MYLTPIQIDIIASFPTEGRAFPLAFLCVLQLPPQLKTESHERDEKLLKVVLNTIQTKFSLLQLT